MHVIRIEGARYLWDEATKRLTVDGEHVAFAATVERARQYAAAHRDARHAQTDPVHQAHPVIPMSVC